MAFQVHLFPFFGEIISRQCVKPDSHKSQAITDMSLPKSKNELQAFLTIMNYLNRYSLATAEVCEPLRRLTWVKTESAWNRSFQDLFDRAKALIKKRHMHEILWWNNTTVPSNWCSRGRVESRTAANKKWHELNLRSDKSDKTMPWPTDFASKSLSSVGKWYINIKREALGILHMLEKFQNYYFARELSIITDHKPFIAIVKKCGNIITMTTMYATQNTQIQNMDPLL